MIGPPGSASGRNKSTRRATSKVESPDDIIRQLQKLPWNKRCADCSTKLPSCVNLTVGSFVCITCAGIHRELSQRVKGVGHSSFTEEEAAWMKAMGNDKVNLIWLAKYNPSVERLKAPVDNSNPMQLKAWIRRKYYDKLWYSDPSANGQPGTATQQQQQQRQPAAAQRKRTTAASQPQPTMVQNIPPPANQQQQQPALDLFGGGAPSSQPPASAPASDPFGHDHSFPADFGSSQTRNTSSENQQTPPNSNSNNSFANFPPPEQPPQQQGFANFAPSPSPQQPPSSQSASGAFTNFPQEGQHEQQPEPPKQDFANFPPTQKQEQPNSQQEQPAQQDFASFPPPSPVPQQPQTPPNQSSSGGFANFPQEGQHEQQPAPPQQQPQQDFANFPPSTQQQEQPNSQQQDFASFPPPSQQQPSQPQQQPNNFTSLPPPTEQQQQSKPNQQSQVQQPQSGVGFSPQAQNQQGQAGVAGINSPTRHMSPQQVSTGPTTSQHAPPPSLPNMDHVALVGKSSKDVKRGKVGFKTGQKVYYKTDGVGEVIKIHYDDDMEPFYTISIEGKEKQTTDAYLHAENPIPALLHGVISKLSETQLQSVYEYAIATLHNKEPPGKASNDAFAGLDNTPTIDSKATTTASAAPTPTAPTLAAQTSAGLAHAAKTQMAAPEPPAVLDDPFSGLGPGGSTPMTLGLGAPSENAIIESNPGNTQSKEDTDETQDSKAPTPTAPTPAVPTSAGPADAAKTQMAAPEPPAVQDSLDDVDDPFAGLGPAGSIPMTQGLGAPSENPISESNPGNTQSKEDTSETQDSKIPPLPDIQNGQNMRQANQASSQTGMTPQQPEAGQMASNHPPILSQVGAEMQVSSAEESAAGTNQQAQLTTQGHGQPNQMMQQPYSMMPNGQTPQMMNGNMSLQMPQQQQRMPQDQGQSTMQQNQGHMMIPNQDHMMPQTTMMPQNQGQSLENNQGQLGYPQMMQAQMQRSNQGNPMPGGYPGQHQAQASMMAQAQTQQNQQQLMQNQMPQNQMMHSHGMPQKANPGQASMMQGQAGGQFNGNGMFGGGGFGGMISQANMSQQPGMIPQARGMVGGNNNGMQTLTQPNPYQQQQQAIYLHQQQQQGMMNPQ